MTSSRSNKSKERLPHWLTLLSSLMIVLAFPPWGFWPLIWICLIPWFNALKKASNLKSATFQGFWLCFFMSLFGFYWVASVLQEFGQLPWIVSILGLLGFCLFGQIQFVFFAPFFFYFFKDFPGRVRFWGKTGLALPISRPLLSTVFISALYTAIDWAIPKLFMDSLGHALHGATYLRQTVDLAGPLFLTFLVIAINWTLWQISLICIPSIPFITLKRETNRRSQIGWRGAAEWIVTPCLFLALSWIYGYFRVQEIRSLVQKSPFSVNAAAIQANIGDFDKIAAERGVARAAFQIIDTYSRMSDEALAQNPKVDFLIWPETSFPSTFRTPQTPVEMQLDQKVESFVATRQVPLLFGGYDHSGNHDYNSFFFLRPNGELQTYHKNILLLFGEYIPFIDFFPSLKAEFPQVGNFGRGDGPQAFRLDIQKSNPQVGSIKIAPIICYEALFTQYVGDSIRQGAQLILNITNDSWFGKWGEPQLHAALSIFRSIENRVPMLRVTNTGISSLILPDGESTQNTAIGVPTILSAQVPVYPPIPTLMKKWGDWFGPVCLGFVLVWIIAARLVEQPRVIWNHFRRLF